MDKARQHTQPPQVKSTCFRKGLQWGFRFEGQGPINFHDFQHDKIEGAPVSRNLEGESHLQKAKWPEQDGTVTLWVKEIITGAGHSSVIDWWTLGGKIDRKHLPTSCTKRFLGEFR
ncbi:hypothetical protein NE237_023488 [Protea cynaroides]|uniref:Uncharacterized protein n=1 Tax=Protea cynaroides TaxID=273540 RepID=A0A9Q0HH72_9MAGN|nr:hypothetical protein NE237_023488 [Protea cynaroides]